MNKRFPRHNYIFYIQSRMLSFRKKGIQRIGAGGEKMELVGQRGGGGEMTGKP